MEKDESKITINNSGIPESELSEDCVLWDRPTEDQIFQILSVGELTHDVFEDGVKTQYRLIRWEKLGGSSPRTWKCFSSRVLSAIAEGKVTPGKFQLYLGSAVEGYEYFTLRKYRDVPAPIVYGRIPTK